MAVTALVVALTLGLGTAHAFQCPTLIKRGRDAAATMDANDAKVKQARSRLDHAEALHTQGNHTESVKEATEALGMLGVTK